jgi:hypothetical protein
MINRRGREAALNVVSQRVESRTPFWPSYTLRQSPRRVTQTPTLLRVTRGAVGVNTVARNHPAPSTQAGTRGRRCVLLLAQRGDGNLLILRQQKNRQGRNAILR